MRLILLNKTKNNTPSSLYIDFQPHVPSQHLIPSKYPVSICFHSIENIIFIDFYDMDGFDEIISKHLVNVDNISIRPKAPVTHAA